MLDRHAITLLHKPLKKGAETLNRRNITANQVSIAGFVIGMLTIPFLTFNWYLPALAVILFNRLCDGLDGQLARLNSPTDAGGYLDITLDFIFYSAVIFGFALADPARNSLPAAALIFAFMGTGSSFLAFAVMAERNSIKSLTYPSKGFYYLGGLAEGTETILFLVLICLLPHHFPILAWIFAGICYLTTTIRLFSGYKTLKQTKNTDKRADR